MPAAAMETQSRPASLHREAGTAPIPGYRLLNPLGKGGFGEVWKCEAPGGILKAIKFIRGNCSSPSANLQQAAQELKALKRVIAIRHPFIVQMDRIEEVGHELLIVMELADRTLHELLDSYRQSGFAGIPRDELLSYMAEAAEALDHMNQEHGLMHLDIKPGNLFLVAGHVKVADFGLVTDLGRLGDGTQTVTQASEQFTGITPLYVAPETLQGRIHGNSDQYSLAIVYQELLTGMLPYSGKNPRQLAMQHMMAEPNLQSLPPNDVPIVMRALCKDPAARFPSCLAFVHALISGQVEGSETRGDMRSSARLIRKLQGLDTAKEINLASTDFSHQGEVATLQGGIAAGLLPAAPIRRQDPLSGRLGPPSSIPPPTIPRNAVTRPPALSRSSFSLAALSPAADVDALPGFTFKECIGRSPLGELWRVLTPEEEPAMVKVVSGFGGADLAEEDKAVNFLRSVKHPGLLPYEVIQTGPGRLCLLSSVVEETMWERFGRYRGQRMPGIPRQEVLPLLRQAATTLDDLFARYEVLHLSINPRNLMLPPEIGLLIADFGLAHLLWAPTGQSLAQLNSRYGAPELAEGVIHRSCDIFSLALVYQEMVVGVHPLRGQSVRHSGRSRSESSSHKTSSRQLAPDLEALHPAERSVMARAFDPDPEQRFQSCLELVDALEHAQTNLSSYAAGKKQTMPTVLGPASGSWTDLNVHATASPAQTVSEIVGTIVAAWPTESINSIRYIHRRGELLHHRCGAMLVAGLAKAKLDGFRLAIGAELVRREENVYVYRVPRAAKGFWKSLRSQQVGLEVTLHLAKPMIRQALLTDVTVQIQPYGVSAVDEAEDLIKEAGPRIVETLRTFLQAGPDRRANERFEYNVPLKVAAMSARGERGPGVQCQGKDISLGGIAFYSPMEIRGTQLRVDLVHPCQPNPVPVLGQLIRCDQHLEGGWFEIGVRFQLENLLANSRGAYR
jgi:serine/threonine protein kinase